MELSYNRERNPCSHKGIEFLASKVFLIRIDCRSILDIVKKNLSKCKHHGDSCIAKYCLTNVLSLWTHVGIDKSFNKV